MTDFKTTSNSEAVNILSASRDKFLVTVPIHSCEILKPRTGLGVRGGARRNRTADLFNAIAVLSINQAIDSNGHHL
jgi:hypothetical protein